MSDLEQRLRDALAGTAATVDDRVERPFPQGSPSRRTAPRRPLLIPLAAAASILLVLGVVLGIAGLRKEKPEPQQRPGIPRFVLLSFPAKGNQPSRLEVRETTTGKLVDTRRSPARNQEFGQVAGQGDNKTFFVHLSSVRDACAAALFRVSVTGSGKLGPLTRITSPKAKDQIQGFAVSRDGRRLAYTTETCFENAPSGEDGLTITHRLHFVDLTNGQQRSLAVDEEGTVQQLAWLPDGRHLLYSTDALSSVKLRMLDTAAPGPLRESDARQIAALSRGDDFDGLAPSPDGRSVYLLVSSREIKREVESQIDGEGPVGLGRESVTVGEVQKVSVHRMDMMTGARGELVRLPGTADAHGAFEISADGRYLMTFTSVRDLRNPSAVSKRLAYPSAQGLSW